MPTMTITYNNGNPRFNPPPGVTYLSPGDSVTVQLAGFPSGSAIDTVTIYNNQVVNGADQKGTSNSSWTSSLGNGSTIYAIAAQSATQVTITDEEHPADEDKYWFGVSGTAAGAAWAVDPELINRPGNPS